MLSAYERRLILSYLSNAASRLHHQSLEAVELTGWVETNADLLALTDWVGKRHERRLGCMDSDRELSAPEWQDMREFLMGKDRTAMGRVRGDRTAQRLRRLGQEMQLSRTDVAILEILLRYRTQPILESMVDTVFEHGRHYRRMTRLFNARGPALPCLLGVSSGAFLGRFAPDAPLVQSGLVSIDPDGEVALIERLHRLASVPGDAGLDAHGLLLDAAPPGELEWSDFEHVAEDRDHVESLLAGAFRVGAAGVNVLVYGPPGTGKTEFCRTLARRLGVNLFSVGESDGDGGEPHRRDRLQELRLAQRLLARSRGSILLFDEMEDLLSDPASAGWLPVMRSDPAHLHAGGSKVFMNRLLEHTPVPTLWTSNVARQTCPTVLRRMKFALELRQPPAGVRARIWARHLARHGIESGDEEARALAAEYDVPPGVASGVTAAARLVDGGDVHAVRRGVRSLARVLAGGRPPPGAPERFDPALVRADADPAALAERLAKSGTRRFSLCLQGPPGTGKSAFVRYLADRLRLEVVQKRASDLLSKWVGDTEQRIAMAFADARDAGHFLVFDEADSLLGDRRFAVRSWEVSQVNEMLTWMESHPLPFACTTNFAERLDPATLRRFDFKFMLDYMTAEQAKAAFRNYFELAPPADIETLDVLTPGDFALVRRKAAILGDLRDPTALVAMLRAECDAKPDRPRRIGFAP